MPKLWYETWKPGAEALDKIRKANSVLVSYEQQGFDLTLRQLYYQFVARGWIPNSDREYKNLGTVVNKARLAGLIDWDHIIDRTRNLQNLPHFNDPAHVISSSLSFFNIERWKDQPYHVEVWIEKDALVGVIDPTCSAEDVGYFSCRGYTSQSEMWGASQRLLKKIGQGKKVLILHMGDHDPSGIDMTRDIRERIWKFMVIDHHRNDMEGSSESIESSISYIDEHFEVDRVALNWDQIQEYDPPPNPAKLSDSRGAAYVAEYGYQSWELDALEPTVLASLITGGIDEVRDPELWSAATDRMDRERDLLRRASERWDEVEMLLDDDDRETA
jgi:hypothetical protein